MFSHIGRLLAGQLKFSTMRPEQMLGCVEFEGEERVLHAHMQNRGVLLFTGAALYAADLAASLREGMQLAHDALHTGLAREKLEELVSFTAVCRQENEA